MQADLPLSMLRLSTGVETETTLKLAGHEMLITTLERLLRMRGIDEGKSMLLMLIFHYSVTANAQLLAGPTMGLSDGLWHGMINSVIWWIVAAIIVSVTGSKQLSRKASA